MKNGFSYSGLSLRGEFQWKFGMGYGEKKGKVWLEKCDEFGSWNWFSEGKSVARFWEISDARRLRIGEAFSFEIEDEFLGEHGIAEEEIKKQTSRKTGQLKLERLFIEVLLRFVSEVLDSGGMNDPLL
jgi:hypothetical protein